MKHLLLGIGLTMVLVACGSREKYETTVSYKEVWQESERAPARGAGWCDSCNFEVYEGHRCKVTHPCQLCMREAGSRHLHQVIWICPVDQSLKAQVHECYDAKACRLCREDKRELLGTRGCDRCYNQALFSGIRGITFYCQTCNQEVGANHIHGKTSFCRRCLREAGEGHVHDATRLCMEHGTEHAPKHVHGLTEYCRACHRDAGPEHVCGVTEWCWLCNAEMEWPHPYHDN